MQSHSLVITTSFILNRRDFLCLVFTVYSCEIFPLQLSRYSHDPVAVIYRYCKRLFLQGQYFANFVKCGFWKYFAGTKFHEWELFAMHLLPYGNIFVGSIFRNIIRASKVKLFIVCSDMLGICLHALGKFAMPVFLGSNIFLCLWSLGVGAFPLQ